MILKYIYTLFVGILLALFVGVGIAAFYQAPKPPDYPNELSYPKTPIGPTMTSSEASQMRQQQIDFDNKQKAYQQTFALYQRNVSTMALVAALIILIISVTVFRNLLIIADGLLLGGVFTLVYSIIRGCIATDTLFRFFVVAVGLAVALILGYIKFIKFAEKSEASIKK